MCLTINQSYHKYFEARIAKEDIYTLKVSLIDNITLLPKSYFRYDSQKYGLLPKVILKKEYYHQSKVLNGYHSLIKSFTGGMFYDSFDKINNSVIIILCRIPRGSRYFIGNDGDIVSNQIELIQPIIGNDEFYNKNKQKLIFENKKLNYTEMDQYLFSTCVKYCKNAGYKIGL